MIKFFKVSGYIMMIISVIQFISIRYDSFLLAVFITCLLLTLGLAFINIGNLHNRVEIIESYLKVMMKEQKINE